MLSKHLIDLNDFSVAELYKIIDLALKIKQNPKEYGKYCEGKIMATLFYEPSTRTQMSFQTAMLRLGGRIIGFDNPMTSSVAKGESLKDTIKIVSSYADLIVVRNPLEGFAKAAALYSDVPVVNAGDGGHLHPTQTLTDLVTLMIERGTIENLTLGLCGDLKNGRTVHSLIKAMVNFNTRFVLISTPELAVPQYIKDIMNSQGCEYSEINSLEEAIPSLDVLYMTRIQRERFASEEEYAKQKNIYVLDKPKMRNAKSDLTILHPLPRVDEIAVEIDNDPRAKYFLQAKYGVYARMSLIINMLCDGEGTKDIMLSKTYPSVSCSNSRCVTNAEAYIPKTFSENGDMLICDFCSERKLI
ncbi:MAG TPA: aspartate carbamoyltransferase [Ruminococcaceae bacterium]|nr:aspartate carbamoyltransferase [Oscillospiraceae bacterium]